MGFQCVRDDNYVSMNSRNKSLLRKRQLVVRLHNLSVKQNVTCGEIFHLEFCTIPLHSPIHINEDVLNCLNSFK